MDDTVPGTATTRPVVVAVDGPSGSGKSSVSRTVAARFGFGYLDTGAMYRATRWWCQDQDVDVTRPQDVAAALAEVEIVVSTDPADPTVRVRGRGREVDLTEAIRDPQISARVSEVATNLAVRADLVARQQTIIARFRQQRRGLVVEGRDITTVVAPDAEVRVLLTASAQARLSRRAAQDRDGGADQDEAATRDQVLRRDADDATVARFTTAADGVTTIDSSDWEFDQTVDALARLITKAASA